MKSPYLLLFLALVLALSACERLSPTPTVKPTRAIAASTRTSVPPTKTATPAKTATHPAITATTLALETLPPRATETTAAPLKTLPPPTATLVPGAFPQVPEVIQILSPGLGSAILSPVTISGEADPTFEQNLVAKVTGENGQVISSANTTIQAEAGKRGKFTVKLPFTTPKEQPGRVAVYNTSPKDGGLIHFTSVELTLKPGGTASLKEGSSVNEILVITSPVPSAAAAFTGGKLMVEGWSGPVFENNLVVILCGEGGTGKADPFCGSADNVLGRVTTKIKASEAGKPGAFSVEVPFKVTKQVSGRVAVYFTSPRDGGLLHLASVPVRLGP